MPGRLIAPLPFLLCAAALAGCDDAEKQEQPAAARDSTLDPPVISEGFTLLPCPATPKSTIDFEGCSEHRILKSDRAINQVARVIFSKRLSRSARTRFVRAERAWLTYRRTACESRSDMFEGGSAAILAFGKCVEAKNRAHLKELRALERNLRPK
jgi:uncharacterized protein YecT (DUF1311 family)